MCISFYKYTELENSTEGRNKKRRVWPSVEEKPATMAWVSFHVWRNVEEQTMQYIGLG